MNIHQLHYFCVLAETQHYTKAAKILSITQPSLTHSIKELEKELEVSLFNKDGRNVKINQFGQFFYEHVRPILSDLEKARNDIQVMTDPRRGTISLSFLYSLAQDFIPHMISSFINIEENSQIKFILNESTTKEIIKDFKENKTEIAFTSKIDEEGFQSIPILKQELFVITPLDHPLANKQEIDLRETSEYPFIFYNQKSGLRPIIDDLFRHINVEPFISFELSDDATVCSFVAANLGIAIVPNIFGLDRYLVKAIKLKSPVYERFIYLSYSTNQYMSPPVTKFKNFILNTFINNKNHAQLSPLDKSCLPLYEEVN
jgi:DNA-binding transcriptional LysR family regulator